MNICSLHKIPVEGSESEAYLAQVAAAQLFISHDGDNAIFMHKHELETDAIDATQWVNEDGTELTLNQRALAYMPILTGEHPPIHDYQNNLSALFRTPAHQLWCAKYEEQPDQFAADLLGMTEMLADVAPAAVPIWESQIVGADYPAVPAAMLRLISALTG